MSQTIFERALEFVKYDTMIGLGSGRASHRFVELLGARVRDGFQVRGVPTSQATADLARRVGIPLVELQQGLKLDLTVDGADEVDPALNMIKGYGRALVREKVVALTSKQLIILVGKEKLVPHLGTRGKLPIEVIPFAVPPVLDFLSSMGIPGTIALVGGKPLVSDNGNTIIDCAVGTDTVGMPKFVDSIEDTLCSFPGVVGTGLFLGMASVVLVGDDDTFALREERRRPVPAEELAVYPWHMFRKQP